MSSSCSEERSFSCDPLTTAALASLGLTYSTGTFCSSARSSTVLLPAEMMPTALAMALAVMGWSPEEKLKKFN